MGAKKKELHEKLDVRRRKVDTRKPVVAQAEESESDSDAEAVVDQGGDWLQYCTGKKPKDSTVSKSAKVFCQDIDEQRQDIETYGYYKNVYAPHPSKKRRLTNQALIDRLIRES